MWHWGKLVHAIPFHVIPCRVGGLGASVVPCSDSCTRASRTVGTSKGIGGGR